MEKGSKPELVPLKREDRHKDLDRDGFAILSDGTKAEIGDPQYNGILPQLKYVVFYDGGFGFLQAVFFVHEEVARGWCREKLMNQMRGEAI